MKPSTKTFHRTYDAGMITIIDKNITSDQLRTEVEKHTDVPNFQVNLVERALWELFYELKTSKSNNGISS